MTRSRLALWLRFSLLQRLSCGVDPSRSGVHPRDRAARKRLLPRLAFIGWLVAVSPGAQTLSGVAALGLQP
jgi:hypothetical protein